MYKSEYWKKLKWWLCVKPPVHVLTCVKQSVNTSPCYLFCILHTSQSVIPPSSWTPAHDPKELTKAEEGKESQDHTGPAACSTGLPSASQLWDKWKLGVGTDLCPPACSFLLTWSIGFVSHPHSGNKDQVMWHKAYWEWRNLKDREQTGWLQWFWEERWVWL